MIKLVSAAELLAAVNSDEAAAVRLCSTAAAYGDDCSVLLCWLQYAGEGVTAAICSLEGEMTLHCPGGADLDELKQFVSVISPRSLYSSVRLFDEQAEHPVYARNIVGGGSFELPDFRAAYDCLKQHFALPEFQYWYVDMSHRCRHECSVCVCDADGAAGAHYYGAAALLCGIAAANEGRGGGRRLLGRLRDALPPQVTRLMAAVRPAGPHGFYLKCGFERVGQVYIM